MQEVQYARISVQVIGINYPPQIKHHLMKPIHCNHFMISFVFAKWMR
jgi:hypothetical protein